MKINTLIEIAIVTLIMAPVLFVVILIEQIFGFFVKYVEALEDEIDGIF